MARTALTVKQIVLGTALGQVQSSSGQMTAVDAANGMVFSNLNGRTFLWVKNNHSTDTLQVTVSTPKTVVGLAVADVVETVAGLAEKMIGPFDADTFHQSGTTNINVDFAESGGSGAVAASKIAAIKVVPSS